MSTGLHFEPKKILVFRIGHLGDTLIALPAFWALRKAYPDAHITLLSNINARNANYLTSRGVLPEKGIFDSWMSYPTDAGKLQTASGFARLILDIRFGGFDTLAYLMTRNRQPYQVERDLKFFKLAGIRQHIGTKYLLENHLPETAVAPLPKLERESDFLLRCLSEEGIAGSASDFDPLLNEAEVAAAEKFLSENVGSNHRDKALIAIAPGSKWDSKIWPEEKFKETLLRLITKRSVFPVIFGGPEDVDKGKWLIKASGIGANAAGKLNVREAAAALAHCRLYLGNDTGTMHLAASVGTPCVAIFSAIDYDGRWYPFGDNNVILRQSVPCEGCHLPVCKFNKECMDTSVDEVFDACMKILDKSA